MRGEGKGQDRPFSYISLESRIPNITVSHLSQSFELATLVRTSQFVLTV